MSTDEKSEKINSHHDTGMGEEINKRFANLPKAKKIDGFSSNTTR